MYSLDNTSLELIPLHTTLSATFVNADFVVCHNQQYFAVQILSLFTLNTCYHIRNLCPSLANAQLLDCCTKISGRISIRRIVTEYSVR